MADGTFNSAFKGLIRNCFWS